MIHIIYFTIFYRYRRCHHSIFYGYLLVLYQPTRWRHNPSVGHIQPNKMLQMLKKKIFLKILFHLKKRLKSWNNRTCIALYCIDFHRSLPEVCGCLETTKVNKCCALDNKKHNTSSSAHLICLNGILIPPRSLKTASLSAGSGRFRWVSHFEQDIYPGRSIKRGVS